MSLGSNKIKLTPPPGKKLIREWEGLRVRSKEAMRNAHAEFPAGTEFMVTSATGGVGLTLKSVKCSCCGIALFITRIRSHDVEVVHEHADAA